MMRLNVQKNSHGFTLIEVVVTIIALGIIGATILLPIASSLRNSPVIDQNTVAMQLAEARIELILAQKHIQGFSGYSDPCPGPAVCTAPSGYTVTANIANNWLGNTNYNEITVTVSGDGDAILTTLVANY